jgi:hypothetical protein
MAVPGVNTAPEARVSTSERTLAKPGRPRWPGPAWVWFAGCGMLVAGGFCYGRLRDDGTPLASRKMHRLLRVPPSGSSASGAAECT